MKFLRLFSIIVLTFLSAQAWCITISNVSHAPISIDTKESVPVTIRFQLSATASIKLTVYDGRDNAIYWQTSDTELNAGEHTLLWTGQDQAGRPVPPEAYRYTLQAQNDEGETAEYDVSDITGGERILANYVKWDSKKKQISYLLPKHARVAIRIGLKNRGPMLHTLLNWVPRQSGQQVEHWSGNDNSGLLDISKHKHKDISVLAYSLSQNTIFVTPASNKINFINDMSWTSAKRTIKQRPKKRMHAYRQQPLVTIGDFPIYLTLPETLEKTNDGTPIITETTSIRLSINQADRSRVQNQRLEPVFYVDGQYIFETEVGYLPVTWQWDPAGTNEGIHYITANIRGYEGNFGTVTIKVFVKRTEQSVKK